MLRALANHFYLFWARIANIGITDGLSFHEKKKTQLLNIVVASGLPLNIFFSILNLSHAKTVLGIINIFLFLGGVSILIINSYRKFLLGRLILTFLAGVLFSVSAFLFGNGGEYFLIVNLVVIIIYFNERRYLVLFSIVNCLLFIAVKIYLHTSHTFDTVPFSRVIFNISWSLLVIVLALLFFKKEQKDYEGQVEEKNRELEKLNSTKEKLFSIIAHDLRSPIAQLKNSLDLVNRGQISPETFQQITSKLSSEVDHLHSTLDNLLRWSMSQFHGIKAVPEKINLADVVNRQALLFKQSLEQKNIKFSQHGTGVFVLADPDHIMLIIRNLLSNAIKYSYADGSISIRASIEDDTILIEVADTGIGMSDAMQESIFNTNHVVSSTGTFNEKGTGLGLKLCKEFIEKNNGEMWVKTAAEKGTIVYISLPEA
jgi:two-component system sensor histidine kinase/response regulator